MPFCWFCHAAAQFTTSYFNDPKFSDRQVWANNVDPDPKEQSDQEQSDQGPNCLLFHLHSLDALLYGKTTLFKF